MNKDHFRIYRNLQRKWLCSHVGNRHTSWTIGKQYFFKLVETFSNRKEASRKVGQIFQIWNERKYLKKSRWWWWSGHHLPLKVHALGSWSSSRNSTRGDLQGLDLGRPLKSTGEHVLRSDCGTPVPVRLPVSRCGPSLLHVLLPLPWTRLGEGGCLARACVILPPKLWAK